jgi:hypothetical protein
MVTLPPAMLESGYAEINPHRNPGDLAAHGYGLNAMCERCRRRTDLELRASDQIGLAGCFVIGSALLSIAGPRAAGAMRGRPPRRQCSTSC